jgi:hypothetical protein
MNKDVRVLVGVPIPRSYMCNAQVIAQIEAWSSHNNVETYYPATSSPEEGQSKIVDFAMYMKPQATHILFLDYDVLPRANTLSKLVSHDKDIISGVYPLCKGERIDWCLSKEEPFVQMPFDELPNNLFKAKSICNGIMLVKTEVFEKLRRPFWEYQYDGIKKILAPDLNFFKKAREAGYDLWVDPQVKCEHFRTVGLLRLANGLKKQKRGGGE